MPRSAVVLLAGVTALALLGSACSSDAPKAVHSSDSPSPTATLTQHPLPPARSIGNDLARRKHVTLTSCAALPGGWRAGGTATNPGRASVRYTITVFFTTTTATVLDYATTTVTVPAGGHTGWQATAHFAAPDKLRCVLRGVA